MSDRNARMEGLRQALRWLIVPALVVTYWLVAVPLIFEMDRQAYERCQGVEKERRSLCAGPVAAPKYKPGPAGYDRYDWTRSYHSVDGYGLVPSLFAALAMLLWLVHAFARWMANRDIAGADGSLDGRAD